MHRAGVKPDNPVKGFQALFAKGWCLAGFRSLKINEPHFVSETKRGSLTIQEEQILEGHQESCFHFPPETVDTELTE